ncbi:hypothetical protein DYB32_000481 [Aphanomyces invadans]|uniref:Uncharacterized protein n=1 Tax=Aphanomyces invadans TaxID=157072 RepID=A0A418B9V4_9STRA|nr:hypothetical protein DYB32_000481 [Aphanomyces invadans]
MRVSSVGLGGMLLATATHTTSARTCGDKSPLDAKCADLFPTCPDRHSPAIFNGCYHCAHDVTCVIKSFAVVNVKEMVQANEENDGDDVKDESAAAKSAGDKDRQVWSEAGSHLNAVTATTTESTTGTPYLFDASSLAHKLQSAVRDLRVACRVSYAFQINEDKMTTWKDASLRNVLKSVHVTPEVQAKIHAVYDEALAQMRTLLDETYDRTVAEMTHRLDGFEKVPRARASGARHGLIQHLRYATVKLDLEHVIEEMHKEHEHQRSHVVYLETRLKALEATPDRGDVALCNQLRERVAKLEAALEDAAARCVTIENEHATAVSTLREAKWAMTQGMHARETSQLCDIIRMNEAQFMHVATAHKSLPVKTAASSPTRVQRYDPHSGRALMHVTHLSTDLVAAAPGVQYISSSPTRPPARPPSPQPRHPRPNTTPSGNPLPLLPTATVERPYV